MSVRTLQVTIGAGVTQVSSVPLYARWATLQNNAGNGMRVGDSATTASRGASLSASGGTAELEPTTVNGEAHNLQNWWVAGTQNDVLDVIYGAINF